MAGIASLSDPHLPPVRKCCLLRLCCVARGAADVDPSQVHDNVQESTGNRNRQKGIAAVASMMSVEVHMLSALSVMVYGRSMKFDPDALVLVAAAPVRE